MVVGLSFRVLDRFALAHERQDIPIRSQKQKAVLAWFVLSGQSEVRRDWLADLLWSGSDQEKARGSLRSLLHLMPPVGGAELIGSSRASLKAAFGPVPCEVRLALAAWDGGDSAPLTRIDLTEAETRFAADLWGLDPQYDAFLAEARVRYVAGLTDALRDRLRDGAAGAALRPVAERLRELTPEDELATRALMRIDMAAGNNAAALAHYDRLWSVLDEAFDIEPSEETQALAVSIKMPAAAPQPRATGVERITIFLQPFPTTALSPEDQMAVSGLQAELVSALFAVEDWVTIETSPGMALPQSPGCFELRGMLSPGLDDLRLILTLKDLSTSHLIWSWPIAMDPGRWRRNSDFAIQRIAARLTGKVESHFQSITAAIPDGDLEDYAKLVRARWLMRDWTADADQRAEHLLRAVAGHPDFGIRARVGLVDLLNSRELIFPGIGPVHAGVPEAYEIAKLCVAEAPDSAPAWMAYAWSCLLTNRLDAAEEAGLTVASLSSSVPRRLAAAAEAVSLAGNLRRGQALAAQAADLDPGTCRFTLGYRISVALLSDANTLAADLAERAAGAIIFGNAYGAVAAQRLGQADRAGRLWDAFCEDLFGRWQGAALPDPVAWLAAAISMRPGKGLEPTIATLAEIRDLRWNRQPRQERVV
jgi:DNA-binding SARP family transcriptional activator